MDGASVGSLGLASKVLQPGWQVAASIPWGHWLFSFTLCTSNLTREKQLPLLFIPTLELLRTGLFAGKYADDISLNTS